MKKTKQKVKSRKRGANKPLLSAVPSYSISKKKVELLYGVIHEEIMKVRIKLCNLSDKELSSQVNEELAGLCYKAPEMAINLFKKA